jgi:hypothetical protein
MTLRMETTATETMYITVGSFRKMAAAAAIVGMAFAVTQMAQPGFAQTKGSTRSAVGSGAGDQNGAVLTGRQAWNAKRAMGGPNWRP